MARSLDKRLKGVRKQRRRLIRFGMKDYGMLRETRRMFEDA